MKETYSRAWHHMGFILGVMEDEGFYKDWIASGYSITDFKELKKALQFQDLRFSETLSKTNSCEHIPDEKTYYRERVCCKCGISITPQSWVSCDKRSKITLTTNR